MLSADACDYCGRLFTATDDAWCPECDPKDSWTPTGQVTDLHIGERLAAWYRPKNFDRIERADQKAS